MGEADWNKEKSRLENEIEHLAVKIEAENKMRLGVEEYKRKLTDEMHVVQLKLEMHSRQLMEGYKQKLDAEVGNFQRKSELAARDIATLEEQKQQLLGEVQDLRIKIGGELEHITERLEADTRSNYTLEGYRRKLGDELFLVKRRLGLLA